MKKLLVVVDMQNDFVTGCLGSSEAQTIVDRLAEYVKKFDGDVVFTQDTHGEDYMNTQEGRKLPVPHCIQGSDGWKIIPRLSGVAEKNKVFLKPTFASKELAAYVADNYGKGENYAEVELCGVCTGICVLSNACMIKGFVPELPVKVLGDLCACVTPKTHETALDAMRTFQIDIA